MIKYLIHTPLLLIFRKVIPLFFHKWYRKWTLWLFRSLISKGDWFVGSAFNQKVSLESWTGHDRGRRWFFFGVVLWKLYQTFKYFAHIEQEGEWWALCSFISSQLSTGNVPYHSVVISRGLGHTGQFGGVLVDVAHLIVSSAKCFP